MVGRFPMPDMKEQEFIWQKKIVESVHRLNVNTSYSKNLSKLMWNAVCHLFMLFIDRELFTRSIRKQVWRRAVSTEMICGKLEAVHAKVSLLSLASLAPRISSKLVLVDAKHIILASTKTNLLDSLEDMLVSLLPIWYGWVFKKAQRAMNAFISGDAFSNSWVTGSLDKQASFLNKIRLIHRCPRRLMFVVSGPKDI